MSDQNDLAVRLFETVSHANESYTEVVQAAKVSQDCKIDKRKRVEIRTVFRA